MAEYRPYFLLRMLYLGGALMKYCIRIGKLLTVILTHEDQQRHPLLTSGLVDQLLVLRSAVTRNLLVMGLPPCQVFKSPTCLVGLSRMTGPHGLT